MKRFLLHVLLFALIALGLTSILDVAITAGLHKVRTSNYAEWNDIRAGAAGADIIIQGSSRAWTGLSPAILRDKTGMSVYNLGVNGYPLDMQLTRYQMFREHNPRPKVIVQMLDLYGFVTRDKIFEPTQFLAFLDDRFLQRDLSRYDYFRWFDYQLPLVRYRGEPGTVGMGLLQLAGLRDFRTKKVAGYLGQERSWDPKALADFVARNPNGTSYMIAPEVEAGLNDFLQRCSDEEVFVVLVYPPEYIQVQPLTNNRSQIMAVYKRLAGKYGFPFLDYSGDPICQDTQYFYNSQHMNIRGAEKFSTEFANELQRMLRDRRRAAAAGG
jgi:hypothetical protein